MEQPRRYCQCLRSHGQQRITRTKFQACMLLSLDATRIRRMSTAGSVWTCRTVVVSINGRAVVSQSLVKHGGGFQSLKYISWQLGSLFCMARSILRFHLFYMRIFCFLAFWEVDLSEAFSHGLWKDQVRLSMAILHDGWRYRLQR